jgi:hypothetical protein
MKIIQNDLDTDDEARSVVHHVLDEIERRKAAGLPVPAPGKLVCRMCGDCGDVWLFADEGIDHVCAVPS